MHTPAPAFPGHRRVLLFSLLLLLLTVLYYLPFFSLHKGIIRVPLNPREFATDLTPQFGVQAEIWRRSLLDHGVLPHWSPYTMGGQPFLAEPGVRFVSFEQILMLALPGQTAARLGIPLHVFIGWVGLYLFLLALGLKEQQALLAGAVYLLNPSYMAFNAFAGHLNIVYGVAFVPWLLYFAVRPFRRRWSRAIWLAAALSAMAHAGAGEIFVFAAVYGFPSYLVYRGLCRGETRQAVLDAAAAVALVAGLTCVRILPALDFLAVSQRQHGMDAWRAFCGRHQDFFTAAGYCLKCGMAEETVVVASYGTLIPLLLLVLAGGGAIWKRRRLLLAVGLVVAALPALVTYNFPCFEVFWKLPIFSGQRSPSKAVCLTFLVIGLFAAAGSAALPQLFRGRGARLARALAWVITLDVLCSVFLVRPPLPTLDDLQARVANNPVLRHVGTDPGFFRVTSYQDSDQHWSWEHQTVPAGIRLLMGYPRLWHGDMLYSEFTQSAGKPQFPFVPLLYRNYAAMAGLLSVKYVASTTPLDLPGLEFVAHFTIPEPAPQPPKSAGPYLYRNTRAMPQAYAGTLTLLLAGEFDWARRTCLDLLADPRWPSDRLTLLYLPPAAGPADSVALAAADGILAQPGCPVPPEHQGKVLTRAALEGLIESGGERLAVLAVREANPQNLRIPVGPELRGRWLVLSETFAMFNGWRAVLKKESKARELPLFRCNHVNSAVWVPADAEGEIELTYATPHLALGLGIMAATLLAVAGYGWLGHRTADGRS